MRKPPTPYALGNLGNAVYSLATSSMPLKDRLESVLIDKVVHVKAKDVGDELALDLKRIWEKATALGENGDVKSVAKTLNSMSDLEQQELAACILKLHHDVRRASRDHDCSRTQEK